MPKGAPNGGSRSKERTALAEPTVFVVVAVLRQALMEVAGCSFRSWSTEEVAIGGMVEERMWERQEIQTNAQLSSHWCTRWNAELATKVDQEGQKSEGVPSVESVVDLSTLLFAADRSFSDLCADLVKVALARALETVLAGVQLGLELCTVVSIRR